MLHIQETDSYYFPMATAAQPYLLGDLLRRAFPELPETAGEQMEGELEARNQANRNWRGRYGDVGPSGPAASQIFTEADERDHRNP